MPLRAINNGLVIHSFEYKTEDWLELKSSVDKANLTMSCCDRKAVPKTSKLGTQYFAHAKRGDCTSAPETQEHLYLKCLVAKLAKQNGWQVITEHKGETPNGETWIADVFCHKGKAKFVFEIQWSSQTLETYKLRTQKYTNSGVRCAWLFRIRANVDYYREDYYESQELPYFAFKLAMVNILFLDIMNQYTHL